MTRPMTFRASWHDYSSRCIYMVTLSKRPEVEPFGQLAGEVTDPSSVRIVCSPRGRAVRDQVHGLSLIEPAIRVLQYAVMPDHLHILLFVTRPMTEPLGSVIARFKIAVNRAVGGEPVFEEGFNDQILKTDRSLDRLFRYIRQNPYRLAVRRARPEYFRRLRSLTFGEIRCEAYGNPFLLRNPFKSQVVVHRRDDEAARALRRQEWLHVAANGGVLVSPFISPAEKAIRAEAEALGGRFILLVDIPFTDRYKPSGKDFSLCVQGRMLIISARFFSGFSPAASISRARCLSLNSLASRIVSD